MLDMRMQILTCACEAYAHVRMFSHVHGQPWLVFTAGLQYLIIEDLMRYLTGIQYLIAVDFLSQSNISLVDSTIYMT